MWYADALLATIPKDSLVRRISTLSRAKMQAVRAAVGFALALDE